MLFSSQTADRLLFRHKQLRAAHVGPEDLGDGDASVGLEVVFQKSDYNYDAKDDDPLAMKRKVVRGGSWKDQKYFIQVQTRTYEFMDTAKCYIGFRCVMPYLGRVKGDNLRTASNVAR